MRRSSLMILSSLGFLGLVPMAHAAEPCGAGSSDVDVQRILDHKGGGIAHLWGTENMSFLPPEQGVRSAVLRVAFPAGSFSPGQSKIRGGAGFEFHQRASPSACLSYKVGFPAGFDFVKGGKLPGLFGGADPRGCVAADKVTGFSARLMWRTDGAGELYLYAPGRDTRCGQSIGRGSWTFKPGVWSTISERATLNSPGAQNGKVEIWIDGTLVLKAENLTLGADASSSVDGFLFSTFFGGGDEGWATPHDQNVDFADFTLSVGGE